MLVATSSSWAIGRSTTAAVLYPRAGKVTAVAMYACPTWICRTASGPAARSARSSARLTCSRSESGRVLSITESPARSTTSVLRRFRSLLNAAELSRAPTPTCPRSSVSAITGSSASRTGGPSASGSRTIVPVSAAKRSGDGRSFTPASTSPSVSTTNTGSFSIPRRSSRCTARTSPRSQASTSASVRARARASAGRSRSRVSHCVSSEPPAPASSSRARS